MDQSKLQDLIDYDAIEEKEAFIKIAQTAYDALSAFKKSGIDEKNYDRNVDQIIQAINDLEKRGLLVGNVTYDIPDHPREIKSHFFGSMIYVIFKIRDREIITDYTKTPKEIASNIIKCYEGIYEMAYGRSRERTIRIKNNAPTRKLEFKTRIKKNAPHTKFKKAMYDDLLELIKSANSHQE